MVNKENYEEYMMLYADGELDEQETQDLLQYVNQHPELQAELNAYMATIIVPDEGIVYADKASLLQQGPKGRTLFFGGWKTYAAAASVAALIALFFLTRNDDINNNIVATINKDIQDLNTKTPEQVITQQPNTKKTHAETAPAKAIAKKTKTIKTPISVDPKQNNDITEQPIEQTQTRQQTTVIALETTPLKQIPGNISPDIANVAHNSNTTIPQPKPTTTTTKPLIANKTEFVPIISDNIALLNTMEQAVAQKIDKAKQVANNIKGSDVVLKLGKKEILIVKL